MPGDRAGRSTDACQLDRQGESAADFVVTSSLNGAPAGV
jgi:hypothetical protein